jgi:hypothetical protein
MNKTETFWARRRAMTIFLPLLLVALVLTACGSTPTAAPEPTAVAVQPTEAVEPTVAPTEPPPTPTEEPPTPTEEPPTPTEPPLTNTPEPTATPTPVPIDDSGCITCHTDDETLKALATEPEAPEVESEGEG